MLNSIVGPPLKGVADFKSPEISPTELSKDEKKARSDSFGEVLETKVAPRKAKDREEMKSNRAESRKPLREKPPAETRGHVDQEENRRPESDDKAEKVTATKENGVEKKTKTGSQRQNAILNFMDSFESEFGVPPTRLVEAMANLTPNEQVDSPEDTVDHVIDQLGLDDQQEDQAKEMYVGLLAQLAQIDKTNPPTLLSKAPVEAMYVSTPATTAEVQDRFTAMQEKRQVLNHSLDSMNQKFWMQGKEAPLPAGTELADKLAQMNLQEKWGQPQAPQIDEIPENSRWTEIQNQDQVPIPKAESPTPGLKNSEAEKASSPEEALAALVAAARAAKGKVASQGKTGSEELNSGLTETAAAEIPKADSLQGKPLEKGEVLNSVNSTQTSPKEFQFGQQPSQQGFQQSAGNSAKEEIQVKAQKSEKADFKKSLGHEHPSALSMHSQSDRGPNTGPVVTGSAAPPLAPTGAENEANVRQIMNQASYLIKKGGGEMKVQMTPEGIGSIHMKVAVQDGKVNVQMAAETQEAKKTLESSLSDLKNSLAAHKLSMDHVKIDVVAGTNTETSTQNQMNQNQSGSREQTQKFWNHFGENFGSPRQQRESFTDVPNLRGYARPRTDRGLEPITSASVKKYTDVGKGKGLDLVA